MIKQCAIVVDVIKYLIYILLSIFFFFFVFSVASTCLNHGNNFINEAEQLADSISCRRLPFV